VGGGKPKTVRQRQEQRRRQDASGTKGKGNCKDAGGTPARRRRRACREKSTGTGTVPKIRSFGQENFVFRCAMLGMEKSRMRGATGIVEGRLHSAEDMQRLKRDPSTATCARRKATGKAKACKSSLRMTVGVGAKKRLMETDANSKFELTNCNHNRLTFPNRNKYRCFLRSNLKLPDSNRQLETIRNRLNPFTINQMTLSNRSKNADPARLASGVRRGGIGVLSPPQAEESKALSSVFWKRSVALHKRQTQDAGSPPTPRLRRAYGMTARRRRRARWPPSEHAIFARRAISEPRTHTGGRRC
jgi:hypothetical protein